MQNEILFHLTKNNLLFLAVIIIVTICCKKALKYKRIYPNIVDHLMQYRFLGKKNYYYSLTIISSVVISYVVVIIYLRIKAFNNPVDLKIIAVFLRETSKKMSTGLLCYNFFVLILMLYLFLLVIKFCKKRLNIHVTKMHFYLMSFDKYIKGHNYFRDHLSLEACFVDSFINLCQKCKNAVYCFYLFGYNKKVVFRHLTEQQIPSKLRIKRNIWTKKEKELFDSVPDRSNRFFETLRRSLKFFFFNLHFIILITLIIYDIVYNNYILKHVAWILPFLFVYQIYVIFSTFVHDKIVYDVSAQINELFYRDFTVINDRLIMIDGEYYDKPNYEEIIIEFLRYEAVEFYYTRKKH